MVIEELQAMKFQEHGGEVVDILRAPAHYIRFHNVKAKRLEMLRENWQETNALISGVDEAHNKRDLLAKSINGLGMKEASHFLRNIGFLNLAIIDRHLITNLVYCGLYCELDPPTTPTKYRAIEQRFASFADAVCIPLDELDLLFWSRMTGVILK